MESLEAQQTAHAPGITTPVAHTVSPLSHDYVNSKGLVYMEDVMNFALQIACGLQHLQNMQVLPLYSSVILNLQVLPLYSSVILNLQVLPLYSSVILNLQVLPLYGSVILNLQVLALSVLLAGSRTLNLETIYRSGCGLATVSLVLDDAW